MTAWLVVAACLWLLAAVGVSMLPMRWQYLPGSVLLVAGIVLAGLLARALGPLAALAAALAIASMFRRPLVALARRLAGRA
ncbi:DUF2484 family protein [Tranquillimonas rosea]|uniref:DUF2484 family protein n=1 Tax=Tranquillimonas rosea TaxID=641238 RepID=UPI003BA9305C